MVLSRDEMWPRVVSTDPSPQRFHVQQERSLLEKTGEETRTRLEPVTGHGATTGVKLRLGPRMSHLEK